MNNELVKNIPQMLVGEELDKALSIYPHYSRKIKGKSVSERLIALQDIYDVFVPNSMSREIYSKIYISLLHSLQKKHTILATRQFSENARRIRQNKYESIIGGADSFTIIGSSGIGKSSSISRAISLLMEGPMIELNDTNVIPCLLVQCPADTSIKGLLLEILRKTDEILDSKYYLNAIRAKSTVDVLIGTVSQVALNHIGIIIIDEIQNVVHKNGNTIIGALTQLINNSGVSICMVGTPECEPFFSSQKVLARRTVGLYYCEMEYGDEYKNFVNALLSYNYTQNTLLIDEKLYMWLFTHSGGNTAITVQLIHDAQEVAILDKTEIIDIASLNKVFETRMRFLHDYIDNKKGAYVTNVKKTNNSIEETNKNAILTKSISDISILCKKTNKDIVSDLKANGINITEVML